VICFTFSSYHIICRLTITQLVLACVIFVLHAATTAMNDHFNAVFAPIKDQLGYLYWGFSDVAATGIWVGIVVSIASSCRSMLVELHKPG